MKKIASTLLAIFLISICLISLTGCNVHEIPKKDKLNLDGYNIVFEDNFDGNSIDYTKWKHNPMKHNNPKLNGIRRACYYTDDMVSVSNGNLNITTKYINDGSLGTGWYTGWLESSIKNHPDFTNYPNYTGFSSKFGYYEIKCMCPPTIGIWSAFWLMPDNNIAFSKNDKQYTAEDGCEIDIMESPNYYKGKSYNQHVMHIDGYDNNHKSDVSPILDVKDMYSNFHTYGMMWSADSLTFYIDGWKTYETKVVVDNKTFGTPKVNEYMILSVEVGGSFDEQGNLYPGKEKDGSKSWAGNPMENDLKKEYNFVVDYVKVYQK